MYIFIYYLNRVFHLSLFLEFSLANFMSDDDSPQEYGDFLSEFFYNGLLPPFASKVSSFLPFSWYFNHIRTFYTELAALNAIHHFLCLEKSFKTSSHTIWIKPIWNSPFTLLIVISRRKIWYFSAIKTFYTEHAALNAINHFLCLEESFKTSSHTI